MAAAKAEIGVGSQYSAVVEVESPPFAAVSEDRQKDSQPAGHSHTDFADSAILAVGGIVARSLSAGGLFHY